MSTMAGKRIFLREMTEDDVDARYVSFFQDRERLKYFSGSKRVFTRDALIEDLKAGRAAGTHHIFGIFLNDGGLCIGSVKIGPIIADHKISDLVTLVGDPSCHGKGFAAEAIELAIKIAFEVYDLRKLVTGMYEDNIASIKAYTKAGFVVEGRLKGHYFVEGRAVDRILVGCYNPKYFPEMAVKPRDV